MRDVLITAAVVSFSLYAHAITTFFRRPRGVDIKMRLLSWSGMVTAGVHSSALWLSVTTRPAIALYAALSCYVCGLVLFLWAQAHTRVHPPALAFDDEVPRHVHDSGPYALMPHPFYTAYSLTWIGGMVAVPHVLVLLLGAWMIALYWLAARHEVRVIRQSARRDDYDMYRSRRPWH